MEMEYKELIIDCIFFVFVISCSFMLGYLLNETNFNLSEINDTNLSEITNIESCQNKTLEESAYCLRDYVKSFYKYNVTDDSKNLTINELKEVGGDCRDFSLLYEQLAEQLGFYADTKPIYTNEFGHRFAIIWNENLDYCILDQMIIKC